MNRRIALALAALLAANLPATAGTSGTSATAGTSGTPASAGEADTPASAGTQASPVGAWRAEMIGAAGVLDQAEPALVIMANGQVSGTGGCNRLSGQARLENASMIFGALATTRMACAGAVMEQEQAFLSALETVAAWRAADPARLELLGADGAVLLVFARSTDGG